MSYCAACSIKLFIISISLTALIITIMSTTKIPKCECEKPKMESITTPGVIGYLPAEIRTGNNNTFIDFTKKANE